ncbi:MAG: hypothetical protein LH478_09790 [Chitinophagaceae bacterium]|nr:hypothetical protein [Chitinophagaceae bacterium]
MRRITLFLIMILGSYFSQGQDTVKPLVIDTPIIEPAIIDTPLRIINLNPFFSVHVDSTVNYQFLINKHQQNYFWYLRNAPVGIRINKDNGLFNFKADKSYFLSGKLKYDFNYKVSIGVQNLSDPADRIDTSFIVVFFNTEIISSDLKPTVSGSVYIDEGEVVSFRVLCDEGSFPIENIITSSNVAIGNFKPVLHCNEEFRWQPDFDFVKETDSGKVKIVQLVFIGSTKFKLQDTARVKLIVRNALNYPIAAEQYKMLVHEMNSYVLKLKYTFLQLDKNIKKTKRSRTAFDLTAASTALSGTVLATSKNEDTKRTGLILPSVGLILTPLKEASAPVKTAEQNQATLIRSSIKRLEYVIQDNALVGDKDPDLTQKINKLKEEFKQSQMQLIDVPIEVTNNMTEEDLNRYFNSMQVKKNYRVKKK